MMRGKTTLSTRAAPPPKDWETRRRRAHELELRKPIESDNLSVGEAAIRRLQVIVPWARMGAVLPVTLPTDGRDRAILQWQ